MTMTAHTYRPRVVIVGAGFGGLEVARRLGGQPLDITIIDRTNHHLFQPLLYQVAGAALDISQISWPIRHVLYRWRNIKTIMGEVNGVDTTRQVVSLSDEEEVPYDILILATGSTHAYFGHEDWAKHARGLKTIGDALAIRQHLLRVFEEAECESNPERRQKLMTIVIVGAGATGVELACTIAELAHEDMPEDFRVANTRDARVIVIEAGSRVLSGFPDSLSIYAQKVMEDLGVTVQLGHAVTECRANGVTVNGRLIEAAAIFWAAGVRASPAAQWLGVSADNAGRIRVKSDLSVPGYSGIYAIGDTVSCEQQDGRLVPGLAPAAKQQGRYVADLIKAQLKNKKMSRSFRYRNYGNLATVGKHTAVVEFGRLKLRGRFAWMIWALAHIYFLIGVRNRLLVGLNWMWLYLKGERAARIILSRTSHQREDEDI